MKPILYYTEQCPDTAPFVAELEKLKIAYEPIEILTNLTNFKRFLRLRDTHSAFDLAKEKGYVGIPVLLLANGDAVLELKELAEKLS